MDDAEKAVREAAAQIPTDLRGRLTSENKLSDADRAAINQIAVTSLAPFQPKPETNHPSSPESETAAKDKTKLTTPPKPLEKESK